MPKPADRHVVPHKDGWAVKKPGAERSSAIAPTQREAQAIARGLVERAGGGEMVTHGVDGRIRNSDTVAPGNDPFPPRDKR